MLCAAVCVTRLFTDVTGDSSHPSRTFEVNIYDIGCEIVDLDFTIDFRK